MNQHVHTDGCFSEGAQVCGMDWPVPAQQAGASLDGPVERATKVKTWRERIGAGPDFPLHAPNDVERAMVAEIAELRGGSMAAAPGPRAIRALIADDSYAVSFQSVGQYRSALLQVLAQFERSAA